MKKKQVDGGLLSAGLDQYHGIRSIKENGPIAHMNAVSSILLRSGKVANEMEAMRAAVYEVERAKWVAEDGFQVNRQARAELKQKVEAMKLNHLSPGKRGA